MPNIHKPSELRPCPVPAPTFSGQFGLVPLDAIKVNRESRQRRQIEAESLESSIRARGVLNPLILDQDYNLIAGERRLTAAKAVGLTQVPVRFLSDLDPGERQIIELEENIKRQDLAWQDIVAAASRIHKLFLSRDPDHTIAETARAIGLTQGTVSMNLSVARAMEAAAQTPDGDPMLEGAKSIREAYNIMLRRESRKHGDALMELLEDDPFVEDDGPVAAPAQPAPKISLPPSMDDAPLSGIASPPVPLPPTASGETLREYQRRKVREQEDASATVLTADFCEWAATYAGPKFNLIHCDFPYGIGVFRAQLAGGERDATKYVDNPETYFALLDALLEALPRIWAGSGHLMLWYSERHRDETLRRFVAKAPHLVPAPFPLIWFKSDNAGIVGDYRRHPRHVYETCLLFTGGKRQLIKPMADCYAAPTDKRWHVSAKSEPMLRHFMTMLVDRDTCLLDPTCGGGGALRVAEGLGAGSVLGLEINDDTAELARKALQQSRVLRSL